MTTERIDSRRVAVAILGCYGFRAAAAWLLAYPSSSGVASLVSRFPEGDRLLFRDGATYLLEALATQAPVLRTQMLATGLAALLAGFVGLLPLWWLMVTLTGGRPGARRPPAARRQLGAFLLLAGGMSLARLIALAATVSLALSARSALDDALDERLADIAFLCVTSVGVALWFASSVVHDLSRALVIRLDAGGLTALGMAFRAAGRNWSVVATTAGCHAGTLLLSLALVVACALAVHGIDVSEPGAFRVLSSGALHQITVLLVLGARSAWLRLACVRADELARSVEPRDDDG